MTEREHSGKVVAAHLSVSPALVSMWLAGKARPKRGMAAKVESMSGGAVAAANWTTISELAAAVDFLGAPKP